MAFKWTEQRTKAAAFFAVGELTYAQIAEEIGVTTRTLENWLAETDFKERIAEERERARDLILRIGIADRVNRVRRLDKRWNQIDQIFQERADSPLNISEPGYRTGLLNRTVTSITKGDYVSVEEEFKPELGLLKEERELMKQAAIEVGQWQEKSESNDKLTVVFADDNSASDASRGSTEAPEREEEV